MNVEMDENNQDLNTLKLQQLIFCTETAIRKLFLDAWKISSGKDWENVQGEKVLAMIPDAFKAQRKLLLKGDVNTWDLTLLIKVLRTILKSTLSVGEIKALNVAGKVRNELAHIANGLVSDENFEEWFGELENSLVDAQLCPLEDIARIRNPPIELDTDAGLNSEESKDAEVNAKTLKDTGNREFRLGRFAESVVSYSKAIALGGLLQPDLLGDLYANRSIAYLKQGMAEQAVQDGLYATRVKFHSYKTHFRLAQAQIENSQLLEACSSLEQAIVFLPRNAKEADRKALTDLLTETKEKFGRVERREELNLNYSGTHYRNQATRAQLKAMMGLAADSEVDTEKLLEDLSVNVPPSIEKHIPGFRLVSEGIALGKQGKREQSFSKFLMAAVESQNAEAMYNLGLLMMRGEGTRKNMEQGRDWIRKAAECPVPAGPEYIPLRDRAIGVSSALHSMGLSYSEGALVPKDPQRAVMYWERAAALDNPQSLNTLGCCHDDGTHGKTMDREIAMDYYRKAAKLGDATAMTNLAKMYMVLHDFEKAWTWANSAIEHGDYNANEFLSTLEQLRQDKAEFEASKKMATELDLDEVLKPLKNLSKPLLQPDHSPGTAEVERMMKTHPSTYLKRLLDVSRSFAECSKLVLQVMQAQDLIGLAHRVAALLRTPDSSLVTANSGGSHLVYRFGKLFEEERIARPLLAFVDKRDVAVIKLRYNLSQQSDVVRNCAILEKALSDDPQDPHAMYLLAMMLAWEGPTNNFDRSIQLALRAFSLLDPSMKDEDPVKLDMLYVIGSLHYQCVEKNALSGEFHSKRAESFFRRYLVVGEPDGHRKVPMAYYSLGALLLRDVKTREGIANVTALLQEVRQLYNMGLAADEKLPDFLKAGHGPQKALIEVTLRGSDALIRSSERLQTEESAENEGSPFVVAHDDDVAKRKFERTTTRESLILRPMRLNVADWWVTLQAEKRKKRPSMSWTSPAPLVSTFRANDIDDDLKPIDLEQLLGPRKDQVLFGRYLRCLVIVKPYTVISVQCLVEDESRYPALLSIYNAGKSLLRRIKVGTVLYIRNPYSRCSTSSEPMIRVDRPEETIKVLEDEFVPLCWGCLRSGVPLQKCTRCNQATYCSQACQRQDWQEFGHKLSCLENV